MSRNPFINAGAAFAYIVAVAFVLFYGLKNTGPGIIMPITILSLLVLSVLTMGYTLLLTPLRLCFEQRAAEAVTLFVQTLAVFAGIVGLLVLACILLF